MNSYPFSRFIDKVELISGKLTSPEYILFAKRLIKPL